MTDQERENYLETILDLRQRLAEAENRRPRPVKPRGAKAGCGACKQSGVCWCVLAGPAGPRVTWTTNTVPAPNVQRYG